MLNEIAYALHQGGGVIHTPAYRHLRNQFTRALASGELVRAFPGVLIARSLAEEPLVRARAALTWKPNHVLMGPAAAQATFWPGCPVDAIDLAGAKLRSIPKGVRLHQLPVPAELQISAGIGRLTSPALTVVDLAMMGRWEALCEALRGGAVTLSDLDRSCELVQARLGIGVRRECVRRAAGNPWSIAELDLHELYRQADITGWLGNRRLPGYDEIIIPDVTFDAARVVVEVDGRQYHDTADRFEADRARTNRLVADGWAVLRFTPRMIWREPGLVVAQTRATLAQRA